MTKAPVQIYPIGSEDPVHVLIDSTGIARRPHADAIFPQARNSLLFPLPAFTGSSGLGSRAAALTSPLPTRYDHDAGVSSYRTSRV